MSDAGWVVQIMTSINGGNGQWVTIWNTANCHRTGAIAEWDRLYGAYDGEWEYCRKRKLLRCVRCEVKP